MKRLLPLTSLAVLLAVLVAGPAAALDAEHRAKAAAAIEKGIEYLRANQNEDGSWTSEPGPAITGLALRTLLTQPDIGPEDPAVRKARAYILARVQEDGSITDGILNNYNTAISVSALSLLEGDPEAAEAVKNGQKYLISIQWKEGMTLPDGTEITKDHPYYGGSGYGNSGRPDMSNTAMMLQALHDSGLDCNDPAFVRAMTFVTRCQGVEQNDMNADKIEQDGGFIYATSINKDHVGVPESKANPELMDEITSSAEPVAIPANSLRSYGSITYAGFKSYLYRNLDRDDPLVTDAFAWIEKNFALEHNPGMPDSVNQQGLFYMYMMMGRALDTFGQTTLNTPDGEVDWANALISTVVKRQAEDGSWANSADRWMEGDKNLVTAYSLIALQAALN